MDLYQSLTEPVEGDLQQECNQCGQTKAGSPVSSHLHSGLNKMIHSKISTPIDRAAAARSKSVEFSKCIILVDPLRRCEDIDPSH